MSIDAVDDLETMRPTPKWDAEAHEDIVTELADESLSFHVWSGDWCPDCREQVPDFAAALDAAGVPAERIETYPVEKTDDGKVGPGMDEFDVDLIPTVVVERDGTEVARFVESGPLPIPTMLARELSDE
jgi:thioredoxin 1